MFRRLASVSKTRRRSLWHPYFNLEMAKIPTVIICFILCCVLILTPRRCTGPRRTMVSLIFTLVFRSASILFCICVQSGLTTRQWKKKCPIVSSTPHSTQRGVCDNFILNKEAFVGYMLCATFQARALSLDSLREWIICQWWTHTSMSYALFQKSTIVGWSVMLMAS